MVFVDIADTAARGQASKVQIRKASAIEASWLLDLYLDRIAERDELVWNAAKQRVERVAQMTYDGLVIDEQRDVDGARRELTTAIQLDPRSVPALREMGALQLATGNNELARRFYVRAVQLDGSDRTAMGYLGCSLVRLGRVDEGQRFLNRAGQGPWSACVAAGPATPPGMMSPGTAPRGP
jgi:tetratricopeptide (TPR) repeat protein